MYKRLIYFLPFFLLIGGCANVKNEKPVEIIKGSMNCVVENSTFTLELENGQIVKYIDSVDGELPQETVDILNQEYLVDITDNDEAIRIMNESLKDLNGHCE